MVSSTKKKMLLHSITVSSDMRYPLLNQYIDRITRFALVLLMAACSGLDQEWSHPAIKFLIRMNPTALLWRRDDDGLRDTRARDDWPIYKLARHPSHCTLMPWIAETYPWVLDKHCVFGLIGQYANRSENSRCTAATIQHFFRLGPLRNFA